MDVRRFVRAAQKGLPRTRRGLRILCYHLVGGATAGPVDLPSDEFARHLATLAGKVRVVDLATAVSAVAGGDEEPTAVVTFDDAFRNFFEMAWPLLAERGIPATLFVPTGFVDGRIGSPLTGAALPACNWEQLRELASSPLVTIGSHTCSHLDLRRLSDGDLRAELRDSRARLESKLGVAVRAFCYPRALWNSRTERVVKESYEFAVVGGGRRIDSRNLDPHRLWRTSVRSPGPWRLEAWLKSGVWLEEAAADIVRRLR